MGEVVVLWASPLSLCLLANLQAAAQEQRPAPKPGEYDFTPQRGPNHRRVESLITVKDAAGNSVQKSSHYIELANGLHYLEDGQLKESVERIEPHPRGAAALKGAYKVIFGNSLSGSGATMTAVDDDSIGEPITGISTGSPSGYYANIAIQTPTSNVSFALTNMTIKYAAGGLVVATSVGGINQKAVNFQILACGIGFGLFGPSDLTVENPYFCGVPTI